MTDQYISIHRNVELKSQILYEYKKKGVGSQVGTSVIKN